MLEQQLQSWAGGQAQPALTSLKVTWLVLSCMPEVLQRASGLMYCPTSASISPAGNRGNSWS